MSNKADNHRTVPDPSTITRIKGYPEKLIIYVCEASTYWHSFVILLLILEASWVAGEALLDKNLRQNLHPITLEAQ